MRWLWLAALAAAGCSRQPRSAPGGPARALPDAPHVIDAAVEVEVAWREVPRPSDVSQFGRVIARDGSPYVWAVASDKRRILLAHGSPTGAPQWERDIDWGGAVDLVALDDRLILLSYSHTSSGAELMALAEADGRELWRMPVTALGPIAHSQYLNFSMLREVGGLLVVFGDEIGGRYMEAFTRDGKRLWNRRVAP